MQSAKPRCAYVTWIGKPCQGFPMHGGSLCAVHDPAKRATVREALNERLKSARWAEDAARFDAAVEPWIDDVRRQEAERDAAIADAKMRAWKARR